MNVRGPISEKDKYPNELYSHRIGMCYAGNLNSAYNVKETVQQALSSLQVIPGFTEVSMDNVCKLVTELHEEIVKNACNSLYKKGISGLIITGFCPKTEKIRTFLIDVDDSSFPIKSVSKEILSTSGDIEFLGSGKSEAESKFKSLMETPPLQILKSVIEGKNDTVGGAIQYGAISDYDFKVYGIKDYLIDHDKKKFRPIFSLNGVNLLRDPFMIRNTGFHLQQTYIMPFEYEINELMKKGYNISDDLEL
jgi:hypothetical protein